MDQQSIDKRAERKEIIQRELEWHEHELEARGKQLNFLYDPPAFDHVIDESLQFLAGGTRKLVLDLACGEGKETKLLAENGFSVVSLDLSLAQLQRTRDRLTADGNPNAPAVTFIQANAEELPFKAGSLERLYGKAIVHHLDLELAHEEISRVMADGGRAVLTEPMAHHPLFWLARRLTPGYRTPDERPMIYEELVGFANRFANAKIIEAFLLAPLLAPIRKFGVGEKIYTKVIPVLHQIDRGILRLMPFLKRYAWYDTVFIQK